MDDGSVRFCGWFPSTDDPPPVLEAPPILRTRTPCADVTASVLVFVI